MRALNRLGPGEDWGKVDKPAVELSLLLGPDLLERGELLIHLRPSCGRIGAVIAHFLTVPTQADAQGDAAVGDYVQAGYLLGGVDHVALREQDYPRSQDKVTCDRRRRGQRHEWVQSAVIDTGQLACTGIGLLIRERNVRGLGDNEGT
jgi:hypothetical protein